MTNPPNSWLSRVNSALGMLERPSTRSHTHTSTHPHPRTSKSARRWHAVLRKRRGEGGLRLPSVWSATVRLCRLQLKPLNRTRGVAENQSVEDMDVNVLYRGPTARQPREQSEAGSLSGLQAHFSSNPATSLRVCVLSLIHI